LRRVRPAQVAASIPGRWIASCAGATAPGMRCRNGANKFEALTLSPRNAVRRCPAHCAFAREGQVARTRVCWRRRALAGFPLSIPGNS